MAAINYNIPELFQAAFGDNLHNAPVYSLPSTESNQRNAVQFTGIVTKPQSQARKASWLGTPFMFPITFKRGTYSIYQSDGTISSIGKQDYILPPATLTSFSRAKNITRTNVLGDSGTIKEVFGFDDWKIRIKGLCLDQPDISAYEQLTELLSWEEIAGSIGVSGDLFTDKSINSIAIENIEVSQVQGKPSVIPFNIAAVSDQIPELTVI